MESNSMGKVLCYCVTGATGYIGSSLVKSLLQRGYSVHATGVEIVIFSAKASHLLPIWGDENRLRIFTADLQEEGSFDEAVKGCIGVFHVAASMKFEVPDNQIIDDYVHTNVLEPAVRGTLNLLKSCLRSTTVKRVVFTSSISTMTAKDNSGKWKRIVDESCQAFSDHVWKMKMPGWIYVLSKLQTEEAATHFSKENDIDLVSVITTTVAGPFLTQTVPLSVQVLLSPLTGDPKLYPILTAVSSRMGSIALVHIEDICRAHILLMEHPQAEGRYICSAHSCVMSELVDRLVNECTFSNTKRALEGKHGPVPVEISSKKLKDLGFEFKHSYEDIIRDTVGSCISCGFLSPRVE